MRKYEKIQHVERDKNTCQNRKVFPRERKRHTARRVASARYAVLYSGWVGVPHPRVGEGGYPGQVLMAGGTPSQGWGYPIQILMVRGTHPRSGGTPSKNGGVPLSDFDGWGVSHPIGGSTPSKSRGYPCQILMVGGTSFQVRGYPTQVRGTPNHPDLARGTPPVPHYNQDLVIVPPQDGVPPTIKTWLGYPPTPRMGYPPPSRPGWGTPRPEMGYPPPSRPGWGTPQTWDVVLPHHPDLDGVHPQTWDGVLPRNVNRQTPVKTVPSLVLRTRAVMI